MGFKEYLREAKDDLTIPIKYFKSAIKIKPPVHKDRTNPYSDFIKAISNKSNSYKINTLYTFSPKFFLTVGNTFGKTGNPPVYLIKLKDNVNINDKKVGADVLSGSVKKITKDNEISNHLLFINWNID